MFDIRVFEGLSVEKKYDEALMMLRGLVSGDDTRYVKLANSSALINAVIDDINWCGFYLDDGKRLVLGPFQGMPACTKIEYTKGMCGKCFSSGEMCNILDVHSMPGHIACDASTNSEIVLPLVVDSKIIGVLDLDSQTKARFTDVESKFLSKCVEIIGENI